MDSSTHTAHVADAAPGNWVEKLLPQALLPYAQLMRLDRPIGWWLLLLPCWWGMSLAQVSMGGGLPNLWHAVLFLAGAIVMRGAGCVLNDIADRHIDAQVARTRSRPLPSGRVSLSGAFVFLGVLLLVGLAVLLQFNRLTMITALASMAVVVVYPFLKRVTYWPQAALGLAFNWGALVGWTAETGSFRLADIFLYAGGVFWTLAYDTIYAHQDKDDDLLIGVKSTALKFGDSTAQWLTGFMILSIAALLASVYLAGASWPAYAGIAAAALHGAWQIRSFDGRNSALCLKLFKSNRTFGLLVLCGFLVSCFI